MIEKIKPADARKYLEKSGDWKILTENLCVNDYGFSSYKVDGDQLVILNVYGDGVYWQAYFENKANELGLKKILFATRRKPEGFMRKFGYKICGYVLTKEI